jgi:uncharacterized membrane protein
MKRLIYISNWLYLFSLSLWVGGMFLLGFLAEFNVRFKTLKDQPELASKVMNGIMDIFNVPVVYWCIGLMVSAVILKCLAAQKGWAGYVEPVVTKRRYTKEVLLAVMVVLALYIGSVLRPQMHDLDQQKKANPTEIRLGKKFDALHQRFVWVWTVNMILGLSLFYIHGKEMARFREGSGDPSAE